MNQPDLGKKIAELRKAKGFTQEELVETCNLNVRTLQRIESGEVTPRSYTIKIIFNALDYTPDISFENKSHGFGVTGSVVSKWPGQVYQYVLDLFNLKTNAMKKISILSVTALAIGFGLFMLCSESKAQETSKVKRIIEQANRDYMRRFNNGQVDSIMVQYRADACLLPLPICGKTEIRQYFRSEVNQGYKIMLIKTLSVSVADSIAVEKGEWMLRKDSGEELTGMYLTEWHYSNKKWLIVNDLSGAK
jgi:transcriptional regulator with XRE-family HTH domain/ketosteroid isomerase-like protein